MDIVGVFADADAEDISVRKKQKEHLFITIIILFHAWPYIPATSLEERLSEKICGKKGRREIPVR